jgi:hypothetical protein
MVGVWVMMYKLTGGQFKPGTKEWSGYFITFFIFMSVSTIYSWIWDVYMDWGLWRSKEKETYGLRSVLTFPKWFYYYGIVSDLVLRCLWLPVVFLDPKKTPWITSIGYGTLLALLELWRRWTWAILRVENE